MTDEWQGMLFATTTEPDTSADAPTGALRLCSLNVNSPSTARAQRLLDWLLTGGWNLLVLTEMQPTDGGRLLLNGLHASDFTVHCHPAWRDSRYFTAIATRGIEAAQVTPTAFDPRITAVDLTSPDLPLRLVGLYAPTNGMTADSSTRRADFQQRFIAHLKTIAAPNLCVTGDFNIVEPDHQPHLPAFEPHDYAFYAAFTDLGLRDAYRYVQPNGTDHSWYNARFGSQRLDHTFVSREHLLIETCHYDHTPRTDALSDHAAMVTTLRGPQT